MEHVYNTTKGGEGEWDSNMKEMSSCFGVQIENVGLS